MAPKTPAKKTSQKKKTAVAKPKTRKAAKASPKPKTAPKKVTAKSSKPAAAKPKVSEKPVVEEKPKAPPKVKPKPKPRRIHFSPAALSAIRHDLETERTELAEQLKEIEETVFQAPQSEISGEVGYDSDDYADAGSATFEREKDLSIANNIQDLIDKINRALEKIEEGTYGICESCGNPIDSARLKALPSVVLCLDCKKREERR